MNKAIDVRNVTKVYRLYDRPADRLKESLSIRKKNYHKDFHALRDVSFDVEEGQSVGIIGTNGSGKSTMLKIITGVLTPTDGEVEVQGKISALLELGAGFNMEYTGIENIYMNGTMMGFTKAEMDEKLSLSRNIRQGDDERISTPVSGTSSAANPAIFASKAGSASRSVRATKAGRQSSRRQGVTPGR